MRPHCSARTADRAVATIDQRQLDVRPISRRGCVCVSKTMVSQWATIVARGPTRKSRGQDARGCVAFGEATTSTTVQPDVFDVVIDDAGVVLFLIGLLFLGRWGSAAGE